MLDYATVVRFTMNIPTIERGAHMIKLNIPDMSCGHCAGVITKALKGLDQDAAIHFDMPERTVDIDTSAAIDTVVAALEEAGYPATLRLER